MAGPMSARACSTGAVSGTPAESPARHGWGWGTIARPIPPRPRVNAMNSSAASRHEPAMTPAIVGIIGCGVISDAYLKGAARSDLVRVKACADLRADAARAKAREYGIEAVPVEVLLADPEIEIVVNLTVP